MYAMVLFWHFFCFQSLSVFLCLTDYKLCSTILSRFDPSWPPNSDQIHGPAAYCCAQSWSWRDDTLRYDTIEEINVDSKAEYTA